MTDVMSQDGLYGPEGAANQPPERPAAPGLIDQVTGVFTEPVALFDRLHATPVWKGALVLTVVLSGLVNAIWALKVDVDALLRPTLERNPNLSAEQVDKIIGMQGKFIAPGSIIGALVAIGLGTLFFAFLYWLIGKATAQAGSPRFEQAMSAASVSGLVLLPHAVLTGIMCLLKPVGGLSPERITPTSLGYFVATESIKLEAFFYSLDIFNLAAIVMIFLAARHTLKLKVVGAAACAACFAILVMLVPALMKR